MISRKRNLNPMIQSKWEKISSSENYEKKFEKKSKRKRSVNFQEKDFPNKKGLT
jgi:hypothetical protein